MIHRFDAFEFEPKAMELRRDGELVRVKPKALLLLELLISNSDRVVTKDEVFDKVWAGRIVSDASLTTTVKELRHALGDAGKDAHIIRTVYGRGLRFIADFETDGPNQPNQIVGSSSSATRSATLEGIQIKGCSVAVLPFDNITGGDDDFIGQGLAEDIIHGLSRYHNFEVIARIAVSEYAGNELSAQAIAQGLGARYLVHGSFRRTSERIRVNAQLIDVETGADIWAQRYDRFDEAAKDLIEIQDEITRLIVANVSPVIGQKERRRTRLKDPDKLDAWENYHRGLSITFTFDPKVQAEACVFFDRAIEQNPTFAQPYAALAYALSISNSGRAFDPPDKHSVERIWADQLLAERYAQAAAGLAPNLSFVWFVLARIQVGRDQADLAVETARKAVALNPNQGSSLLGLALALWSVGRSEEALEPIETCLKLVPGGSFEWLALTLKSFAMIGVGNFEEGVRLSREALQYNDYNTFPVIGGLCGLGKLGRIDEAEPLITRLKENNRYVTIERFNLMQPIKDPVTREEVHAGLRLAGIPDS